MFVVNNSIYSRIARKNSIVINETFYEYISNQYSPVPTEIQAYVKSISRLKISNENGVDSCFVEFSCDASDIEEWEARASIESQTPSQGVGLLVGSGSALSQGVTANFSVEDEELTSGDREYVITIYVRKDGVWYG